MAKLITVTPAKAKAARTKMDRLAARDPHLKQQVADMERFESNEKKRRDAEHARKQAEEKGGQK